MTHLKNLQLNLEVGQKTTKGPRKALTFKLCEQKEPLKNPADKYR